MNTLPETLMLPPRTITREGGHVELLSACEEFGPRGFLVHGRSLEACGALESILAGRPHGVTVETWCTRGGEPTLAQLEELLAAARDVAPDWVAGVGGGSAMDIAKACAGLLHAPLPAVEYHSGAPIVGSRTPFVAVPTTAGTGSEATGVSVLTNEQSGIKKSFRHPSFVARIVLLDARLLGSAPVAVIASAGMDAFTQAVESFLSRRSTWITRQISLEAVRLIGTGLEPVFGGEGGGRRADLLTGSYLAGIALTNARLGVVHGLAHPLGARYHAPHGLTCAVCLPHALAFNRDVCEADYARLSTALGADVVAETRRLLDTLGIASPFTGRPVRDTAAIVTEVMASGSTAANPRAVEPADVERLLASIFNAEG